MAEIKAFKVTNLPNDNHYPFNLNVRDYARQCQAVSTQMAAILTPYEQAIEAEDEAMHKSTASPLTPEIEQTDKDRDQTYYIIDHLVDVFLHYPDGQERTDALSIDKYLKINKVNTSAQYDRETGQIMQLTQDLDANCVPEMQRLGLTDHVARLKQLNQRMFDLLQQRDQQLAERVLSAVREARRRVDELYHRLVWAVNAFAFVDAEPYLPFIRNVNQTIDRLNLQVFKITGSSADKNEVDSPDNGDGTPGDATPGEGDNGSNGENNGADTPSNPQPENPGTGTGDNGGNDNTGSGSGSGDNGSGSGTGSGAGSGSGGGIPILPGPGGDDMDL